LTLNVIRPHGISDEAPVPVLVWSKLTFKNLSPIFPFESPLQPFPYFCGSAARTAVVLIARPFLPVHWCTNSKNCFNCLFRCVNSVQIPKLSSSALRLYLRSPGFTTLCKHNLWLNSLALNVPVIFQVLSFAPSLSHCLTDFPTLTSPKSDPGRPTETHFFALS
jgi:hypothetical protein